MCPFCPPQIVDHTLIENDRYRIVADRYPLCVGHLLLLSKAHLSSHMHASEHDFEDFAALQLQMRRFLTVHFGKVAFFENGGINQEVPHAHLHAMPFDLTIPEEMIEQGTFKRLSGWQEVREECQKTGYYCYVETQADCFILSRLSEYKRVLNIMRGQFTTQMKARVDAKTGAVIRCGPEAVEETIRCWSVLQS